MYAVIETGGKQYRVQNGDQICVEKLNVENGAAVVFDKVLVCGEGADIKVGTPYLEGITVDGEAVESGTQPAVYAGRDHSDRRREGSGQGRSSG